MDCRKCQKCETEPRIISSEPVRVGNEVYQRQVFACTDPHSDYYQQAIYMVDTDIFDNSITRVTEL